MRICFLTETIFTLGGVGRVTTTLANALRAQGCEVEVLCVNADTRVDRALYGLREDIPVRCPKEICDDRRRYLLRRALRSVNRSHVKLPLKLQRFIYLPKGYLRRLQRFLQSERYDAVIACQGKLSLMLAAIAFDLSGDSYGWQHNTFEAYFNEKGHYYYNQKGLYAELIPRLDYYIVLNKADEATVEREFKAPCGLHIYNPVDAVGIGEGEKRYDLIFVGRLVKDQKGLDHLTEVLARVCAQRPETRCVVVGDGPDRGFLEEQLKARGLDGAVELAGQRQDVGAFYQASRLLLLPSRWEGFGLVAVEAMSAGLPVVSFETAGPKEILADTGAGALVPCFDVEAMANEALKLLNDEELYAQASAAARARANDFAPETIVSTWLELLS